MCEKICPENRSLFDVVLELKQSANSCNNGPEKYPKGQLHKKEKCVFYGKMCVFYGNELRSIVNASVFMQCSLIFTHGNYTIWQ